MATKEKPTKPARRMRRVCPECRGFDPDCEICNGRGYILKPERFDTRASVNSGGISEFLGKSAGDNRDK